MAWLIVETGNDKGGKVELPLDGPPVMIGRLKECGLTLTDCMASRNHFKVFYKGEVFLIEDLKSHNGTWLNRKKLDAPQPLHDGDRIMVGNTLMSYREELGKSVGVHTGKTIGDYRIIRLLGVGGMGEVYEGHQKSLDRRVAVKILAPELATDTETVDRMIREARNAGKLNHPNVVQVHDVGKADGIYFYSMELVTGGSIQDLITGGRRIEPQLAVKFLLQAAAGLAYAEKQGIVHCDIKPDNLMLAADETVRLADLGISKTLVDGKADQSEGVFGSPHFMSPEQAQGLPLTHKSDIYSLGVTAYRMLSGHLPFDGTTAREIMEHHVFDEPHSLRENAPFLPAKLIEIVEKTLAKNPNQRYPSAKELIEDLSIVEKAMREGVNLPTIQQLKNRNSVRIKKRDNREQGKLIAFAWVLIGLGAALVVIFALWSTLTSQPSDRQAAALVKQADVLYGRNKWEDARSLYRQALAAADVEPEETKHIQTRLQEISERLESPDSPEVQLARRQEALALPEHTPAAMLKKLQMLLKLEFPPDGTDVAQLKFRMSTACAKAIEETLAAAETKLGADDVLAAAAALSQADPWLEPAAEGTAKYNQRWNNLEYKIGNRLPAVWSRVKAEAEKIAKENAGQAHERIAAFRQAVATFDIVKEVDAFAATLPEAVPAPGPAPDPTPPAQE